jgi:hypothetical protein
VRRAPNLAAGALTALVASAASAAPFPVQAVPPQASPPAPAVPRVAPQPIVLATSEGFFASFDEPAGCRTGWVVFHAQRDDRREGIYASSGGAPIPIAETGSELDDQLTVLHMSRFGRLPTVNDAFTVAFTVQFAEGGGAVLASRGGVARYDWIASSAEAFRDFGDLAAVNAATHVLFRATVDPPNHPDRDDYDPTKLADAGQAEHPETIPPPTRLTCDGRRPEFDAGLFVDRIHDVLEVAATSKGVLDVQDGFAFNDLELVAYRACLRQMHWSLVAGPIGAATPVAETGDRFAAFGVPAMDSRGRVAFLAQGAAGDTGICRSRLGAGLPEVVADSADGFVAFGPNVGLDDRGRVVFVASRKDGKERLCVAAAKGAAQEVLVAGDLVGRRAISHLRLSNRPFVRGDRVALVARLEPDVEALILVDLPH